jgi:hypothetical protein
MSRCIPFTGKEDSPGRTKLVNEDQNRLRIRLPREPTEI